MRLGPWLLSCAGIVTAPPLLGAQTPGALTQAAETITAAVKRHVERLAYDSLGNGDTTRPAPEATASYVAEQFEQLGLTPMGARSRDSVSWIRRVRVPGNVRADRALSRIYVRALVPASGTRAAEGGWEEATFSLRNETWQAFDSVATASDWRGEPAPVVLVSGHHTAASARRAAIIDTAGVLYVPPVGTDSATQHAVVEELYRSRRGEGVLVLADDDSITFRQRATAANQRPVVVLDDYMYLGRWPHGWAVHMQPRALKYLLAAVNVDLTQVRADTAPKVRALPSLFLGISPFDSSTPTPPTVPNVVGLLPGSDPKLRHQYIVITAHMDQGDDSLGATKHVGSNSDDNASGVVGLIALAKAFSQPGARPKRSVVFAAVSGGRKGFVGTKFFVWSEWPLLPTVAANINLDMIGRAPGDSVMVDGLREITFATDPTWIAAAHPELGLTVTPGGSVFDPTSDHVAFAHGYLAPKRHFLSIPSISFRNGSHDLDSIGTVDAAQAARILQLVFYVAHDIADTPRRPHWNAEGRRRVKQVQKR